MPGVVNQKINIIVEYFQKNMRGFNEVMNKNLTQFRDITDSSGRLNTRFKNMNNLGARLAHRTRMMTHGMRGFKMEMLGVMFFGMMISRTFTGLMKTSMEWVGVTEILSEALGILFLPIALKLLDWALVFLEFVQKIPDDMKLWIGVAVLLAAVLGGILFIVGSLALGIGSLIMAFGGMAGISSIISSIGSVFAAFGGVILAVIAIVVAVIIGMYTAWRDNFMNMKAVVSNFIDGVKKIFAGLWEMIKGVVNIVLGLLSGDFEKFSKGIKQLFSGLGDFIVGVFKAVGNGIMAILIGIINAIRNVINVMFKAGAAIGNFLSGKGFTTQGALQIPSFDTGGVVPGPVGSPMPIIAHGGERVIPTKGGNSSGEQIVMNVTYNVNVSDKREFENMLRTNNIKLAEDVRRISRS